MARRRIFPYLSCKLPGFIYLSDIVITVATAGTDGLLGLEFAGRNSNGRRVMGIMQSEVCDL